MKNFSTTVSAILISSLGIVAFLASSSSFPELSLVLASYIYFPCFFKLLSDMFDLSMWDISIAGRGPFSYSCSLEGDL